VRPIGNRVLVEPSKAKEVSAGGIVTPEQYRQRDVAWDGVVVAFGSERRTKKGAYITYECEIGQRVLVNRYNAVVHEIGGREMWLVKPEDIIAILEDEMQEGTFGQETAEHIGNLSKSILNR
jgi:chaperonin GroES